jgi:hypothetical protein
VEAAPAVTVPAADGAGAAAAEACAGAGDIDPATEVEEVAVTPDSGAVRTASVEDDAAPADGEAEAAPAEAEGNVAVGNAGAPASGASPAVPTAPTAAAESIEPVEVPAAAPPDPKFASACTGADTSAAPADEPSRASTAVAPDAADASPPRRADRPESALSLALFATSFDPGPVAAFPPAAASFEVCVAAVPPDTFPIDWPFDREADGQMGNAVAGEAPVAEPTHVPATP